MIYGEIALLCILYLGQEYLSLAVYQHSYYSLERLFFHGVDRIRKYPWRTTLLFFSIITLGITALLFDSLASLAYLIPILSLVATTRGRLKITRRSLTFLLTSFFLNCSFITTFSLLVGHSFLLSIFFPLASELSFVLTAALLAPLEHLLARHYKRAARKKLESNRHLKIIGITGSFGKTTTRQFIAQFLGDLHPLSPGGNINTPLGLAAFINKTVSPFDRLLILELGVDKKGGMKKFDFLRLDYALVTAVGAQHLRTFKTLENIKREKLRIQELLRPGGTLFYNEDQVKTEVTRPDIAYRPVSQKEYSVYQKKEKSELIYLDQALLEVPFTSPLVTFDSFLAYQVSLRFICADRLKLIYQNLRLPARRKEVRQLGELTIIDDSYNINLASLKDAVGEALTGRRPCQVVTSGLAETGDDRMMVAEFFRTIAAFDRIFFVKKPSENERRTLAANPQLQKKIVFIRRGPTLEEIGRSGTLLLLTPGDRYSLD